MILLNTRPKLHVFGEWFDPPQSIHAFRDRGALSTVTAQEWRRTTEYLRHSLPRGGESSVCAGEGGGGGVD